MLEHQEYLSLVAELAVAMAGFTGIVAVFQTHGSNPVDLNAVGFLTMLRASLSALLLSLLPYLMLSVTDNVALTWRLANLAVVLVMGRNLSVFIAQGGFKLGSRFGSWVLFPGGVIVWSANVLGIFQILPSPVTFIFAVTWQLIISTHNFAMLILSGSPSSESDTSG